ncbi:MAG: hypothetical protein GXY70_02710 [Euryarchaeota archaeon]|nr:hypothetical protein [Euryarchaeota archaeon]
MLFISLLGTSGEVEAISYTLSLEDPNGGENIPGGTTFDIRLSTSVSGGVLVLTYSTDGGLSFPNEIAVQSNAGGYQVIAWNVPNNVNTTTAKVQVEWRSQEDDPYNVYRSDHSSANFSIFTRALVEFLEVPEVMSYGPYYLARWMLWDGEQAVGGLKMQARFRTGITWGTWTDLGGGCDDIDPFQGGIWFRLPIYYESAYGQLRMSAYTTIPGGVLVTEAVSNEFEVRSPWIQLKTPNGGQALVGGTICTITWATSVDAVGMLVGIGIDYTTNGGSSWTSIQGSSEDDGTHDWVVPDGVNYDHVRVKVTAQIGEWQPLAWDISDGDLRIMDDANAPSVSLIDPNPYVPGAKMFRHGETAYINWSKTGPSTNIDRFEIYLSTNNGSTYSQLLMSAGATATSRTWTVPALDTMTAKIQVRMVMDNADVYVSSSVNPFYIFTDIIWNRPPIARAADGLSALEGALVTLDGSGSSDPDGDPLFYHWEQVDGLGFDVELSDPYAAITTFRASIHDYSVSLIFRLTVSDGDEINITHYVDNIKCTSVLIAPSGPTITGFTPAGGYEGTDICITGTNLKGAGIYIGGVLTGTVPYSPSPSDPDPDTSYNFTLVAGIPPRPSSITVTTAVGSATSEGELEVYPYPWYCLDHGFTFGNDDKEYLSYPWLFWESGDYQRTFGDDVFLSLWICIGIPYWTPWDGWDCLGYEISQPICPDPLAALWYGVAYCHLAQNGECFGLSAVNLELYLDEYQPNDIQQGVYTIDDLELTGALRTRVDYMHGSQVSAECLHYWIAEHLYNLVPSVYGFSGMGAVLKAVEDSIDSGELGIISIVEGTKGHIVVPYATVDIDDDTTRIYIWDINKPEWTTEASAEDALLNGEANMNHPPYIEIDKSGYYWEWSYYFSPGEGWWGTSMGLTFIDSDVVLGDRSLPTTLDGVINLVFGCASGSVEDEDGNVMELLDDGTYRMDIEGASPFTLHSGLGTGTHAYYLPDGNYTTHISGFEEGVYNCTVFSGARAAYAIENAEAMNGTEDTLKLFQEDGNPFMGTMTFRTSDDEKEYSATMVKRFGSRERVFKILNATIFDDSRAVINTTEDYGKLVFRNDGDRSFTFDVRFQGNTLSEEAWDRLNGTLMDIPTCEAFGIEIGPDETLTMYPSDWMDLEGADVIVEREGGDGTFDIMLLALTMGLLVVAAAVIWFLVVRKKKKV